MNDIAKETTALILAGGRGTRIAALTGNVPKPMVMVAGQPFLEWIIRRLICEGFTDIVLSIGHMAEVVENWVATRAPIGKEKIRCHREMQPLGTGGAIADALNIITTPYVLILNGNTLLLENFLPAVQNGGASSPRRDYGAGLDNTGRYGRLGVTNGMLSEFQEKQPGRGLINGGVYVFQTEWLRQRIPSGASSIETDIFPRLLTGRKSPPR